MDSNSGKFNASFVDLCSGDEEASFQTGTINSENTLQGDNRILGWNSDTDEFEAEAQRKKKSINSASISGPSASEYEEDSDFATPKKKRKSRRSMVPEVDTNVFSGTKRSDTVAVKAESEDEVQVLSQPEILRNLNPLIPMKGTKFPSLKAAETFLDKYSAPLHFKFFIESGPHANRGPEKNMNYRV